MTPTPIRPGTVSQELLLDYIRKRNRRLRAEQAEREVAERILAMMLEGAETEPGIHFAVVVTVVSGSRRVCELQVA